jgi:predicted nicotinamide N-methyase
MVYQTEVMTLDIEGLSIEIERITNIDELYEELVAKGVDHRDFIDERIPYWAELWSSALALSRYLVTSGIDFQDRKVLEIGAGLGLPSIVAAKLGAEVTVSDYLPEALEFSKRNFERNGISNVKFEILDWREPNIDFSADILLAADVAYEKRMFEFLPQAFKTFCRHDGAIYVSEPNRGLAKDFLQNLNNQGFKMEKVVTETELFGIPQQVNILKMWQ